MSIESRLLEGRFPEFQILIHFSEVKKGFMMGHEAEESTSFWLSSSMSEAVSIWQRSVLYNPV